MPSSQSTPGNAPSATNNSSSRYYNQVATALFPGESPSDIVEDRIGQSRHNAYSHWQNVCQALYADHCTYLLPMAGWFFFSALLSSYNKYVFGSDHLNFPCPLMLTSIHFASQWGFAVAMCKLFPTFFGSKRIDDMSWSEFLAISVPCGMVTSGDVGLSNLSLVTISITFYTMVKASTPVFVLIWGYYFGIVHITWALCGVILVIALGEFMTVAGEVEFKFTGFLLCLMASILSGARWTLVQLKIQSLDPPLKTTVATMRLLSPFMFLTMLVVSCAIEQPWSSLRGVIDSWGTFFHVFSLGLLGAGLAICMIMCEFWLIMHTTAIILMIGGVIKEMLTIFIGVNFFGDALNWINFGGCVIVFLGVVLYKIIFHLDKEESKAKRAVAMERDDKEEEDEKRALRSAGGPDEIDTRDENGHEYYDKNDFEQLHTINGQQDGIEMRRGVTRNRPSMGIREESLEISKPSKITIV